MSAAERKEQFRELLERSHPRWQGIARAYANPPDRDDLLQEIALQVWRSMGRFNGKSAIDTWAYRVALNTALAWRRKSASRSAKLKQSPADVAELQENKGTENDVQHALDQFLASLGQTDRAVMLLHLDGLSQAEAAEVLGISEGALRTRLHRIRTRFETEHREEETVK